MYGNFARIAKAAAGRAAGPVAAATAVTAAQPSAQAYSVQHREAGPVRRIKVCSPSLLSVSVVVCHVKAAAISALTALKTITAQHLRHWCVLLP